MVVPDKIDCNVYLQDICGNLSPRYKDSSLFSLVSQCPPHQFVQTGPIPDHGSLTLLQSFTTRRSLHVLLLKKGRRQVHAWATTSSSPTLL